MRRELTGRPLLVMAVALAIGLGASQSLWLILLAVPLLWACQSLETRFAVVALLALGLIRPPISPKPLPFERIWCDQMVSVISVPVISEEGRTVDIRTSYGDVRLFWQGETELSLGDEVHVRGVLRPPTPAMEPFFRSRGLVGRISNAMEVQVVRPGSPVFRLGLWWRDSFLAFAKQHLDAKAATAIDALAFNVDAPIPDSWREQLQRTGTTHIISASGLHVFVFAAALLGLFGTLPIPRHWQLALVFCVLIVYCAAAGMRPPVIRAVLMTMLWMPAYLFRREADGLSTLSLAALLVLFWRPNSILDIGFQLSFITVGALIAFTPQLPNWPRGLARKVLATLGYTSHASLVATMAAGPLVAYHFGVLSLISIVANLVILPAVTAVLIAALLAWGFSFVIPPIAVGLLHVVVEPLCGWILAAIESISSLPFAAVNVSPFSPIWLLAYYGLAVMLWRPRARPA